MGRVAGRVGWGVQWWGGVGWGGVRRAWSGVGWGGVERGGVGWGGVRWGREAWGFYIHSSAVCFPRTQLTRPSECPMFARARYQTAPTVKKRATRHTHTHALTHAHKHSPLPRTLFAHNARERS
jgi:hypothetical protein